jgi:hypothetical protein
VCRRISGEAFPGIEEEGVVPNLDSRAPAFASEKRAEGSGLDQRGGAGQTGEEGRAALRLCNLVAQSPSDAEGGLQEGGREGTIYFKPYQSQMPVIERAIETAALILGSDKSRGYCLEMICADFLAGTNLDNGDPATLLFSMTRFFKFLPGEQRLAFLGSLKEKAS